MQRFLWSNLYLYSCHSTPLKTPWCHGVVLTRALAPGSGSQIQCPWEKPSVWVTFSGLSGMFMFFIKTCGCQGGYNSSLQMSPILTGLGSRLFTYMFNIQYLTLADPTPYRWDSLSVGHPVPVPLWLVTGQMVLLCISYTCLQTHSPLYIQHITMQASFRFNRNFLAFILGSVRVLRTISNCF